MQKYMIFIIIIVILLSSSISSAQTFGVRTIETQNVKSGSSINVIINITNNFTQSISFMETIPSGWTLTRISDDSSSFKSSTNEWVWFNIGAGVTKTVKYNLNIPSSVSSGTYQLSGSISNASGIIASVSGDNSIIVEKSGVTITPTPTSQPSQPSQQYSGGQMVSSTQTPIILTPIEIKVTPDFSIEDNISLNVDLTYPTAGYTVIFKEASVKDKIISIDIKTSPPSGIVAQVITTHSHKYNLGNLNTGSYSYIININGESMKKSDFEVSTVNPTLSPTISPNSTIFQNETPVKTPGFTFIITIILILYLRKRGKIKN